jgi:glycosyltransferase involved in cell wall biosynthesis
LDLHNGKAPLGYMKVNHIITGLNDGGAEAVLFRLCTFDTAHQHVVISLSTEGKYGPLLREKGIVVHTLGLRSNRPSPLAFWRLVRLLRSHKPDVVQTWMYHADLLGGLAARMAGIKTIVWGIRHTTLEPGKSKKTTIWIAKLLAKLSWWLPSRIAVCAQRAMDVHEALGYDRSKMRFIPNGYDLSDFTLRPEAEAALRASLGVLSDMPLIGTVGRYDPQKDHANLLHALALLQSRDVAFCCVLVGTQLEKTNAELMALIEQLGLQDRIIILGRRNDIPAVMSALDVHVLPSAYGEAFPNVVAEAMACETPCVVTNVGDAAYIVGDTGWVVSPKDAEALASVIEQAITASATPEWVERCRSARIRIEQQFDIQKMVSAYHAVWSEAF